MNSLPNIALGTWLMGGTKEPDPNNDDLRDIQVIKTAIANDITLIDTAQNYAAGRCEELVGEALKDMPRTAYQILTKQNRLKLRYDEVLQGCRESMKRLGVDYLDYFVCHAPNTETGVAEFFKAANQLYKDGVVRHVGVSNFGPKALQVALDTSEVPIALNQVSFSLLDYDIMRTETYDFCVRHNIPIQAYRTLVGIAEHAELMQLLATMAKRYEVSPQQIALAYIASYENMHVTVRASSAQHWQEIKDALVLKLEPADIDELKEFHSKQVGGFGEFLVM